VLDAEIGEFARSGCWRAPNSKRRPAAALQDAGATYESFRRQERLSFNMVDRKKRHVPPGTYFWILIALLLLAMVVGFINALFYKGDTRQMLGGGAANNSTKKIR
jgi:hypothetical protein